MEIRQVQYFLSIVDTGSFSAAADEHYVSQSTLSKMIMALEKELAVTLFDRSKRKVSLTEAGRVFLEHARKLDVDNKAMLTQMGGFRSSADSFSIGAIPILNQYGIAASISQFKDRHPHIQFNLEEIGGINIIPGLEEHRFDLAFTRNNYLDGKQYELHVICKDKMILVVSKNNRYASRKSISLKELSNDNFILFDKATDLYKLIMDECAKAGFEPSVFFSSHRKVSVFGLVETNIGIALMPLKIYEYHQPPNIVPISLEEEISCDMCLVYPKTRKLTAAAETFVDFIMHTSEINMP
jgi:LysR family transcriptional regulator, transcription activator of glutamate synthase operon